ncbi:MAG: hypothetical protein ACT4QA_21740 [Panacagrimonas sp.]
MTITLAIDVVLTAVLTAAMTWFVAYWVYKRKLEAQLRTMLEQVQIEFEQRVKDGVLAAGEELMPQLREQVKLGFQDALMQTQTGEWVENAASVANTGRDILARNFGSLFGKRPRK